LFSSNFIVFFVLIFDGEFHSSHIQFMNAARQQMAAIPKPNPPVIKPSDDHVTKLRKTVAVAMREFETVHQNVLFVVCGNPTIGTIHCFCCHA
jgi:hypothetical protein